MNTIAYVEENEDNRLLVSAILGDRFHVREYASGPQALAAFRREKPDLVLLDISMPEMDGTEVLQRMREDPELADIPALALTAHAMAGDREKYLSRGFDGYITKPIVDEEELISEIERNLR
ncbi:MAG: response regulator [Gemmatimonadetes bacterium]|nr:response regulator [Gemmatimonadota bacterium]